MTSLSRQVATGPGLQVHGAAYQATADEISERVRLLNSCSQTSLAARELTASSLHDRFQPCRLDAIHEKQALLAWEGRPGSAPPGGLLRPGASAAAGGAATGRGGGDRARPGSATTERRSLPPSLASKQRPGSAGSVRTSSAVCLAQAGLTPQTKLHTALLLGPGDRQQQ